MIDVSSASSSASSSWSCSSGAASGRSGSPASARSSPPRTKRRAGPPRHPLRAAHRHLAQGPGQPDQGLPRRHGKVEHDFPLGRTDLASLTPADLLALSQEEVDQVYGRLTAGPIPDGPYLGDLFFSRGETLRPRLEEILGGLEGRVAGEKVDSPRLPAAPSGRARCSPRTARAQELRRGLPRALGPDRRPRRAGDRRSPARGLAQAHPAHHRRLAALPGQALLRPEPARWAPRVVIIDYAYNDEAPRLSGAPRPRRPQRPPIRDEIRMIRPGFYLGRAYANKVFLLNFMLLQFRGGGRRASDGFARGDEVAEDCWPGEQQQEAAN